MIQYAKVQYVPPSSLRGKKYTIRWLLAMSSARKEYGWFIMHKNRERVLVAILVYCIKALWGR